MSRWIGIPNGKDGEGLFVINTDHIVVYYDIGPIAFDGEDEPERRMTVVLADGSHRVLNMSAADFGARIAVREALG